MITGFLIIIQDIIMDFDFEKFKEYTGARSESAVSALMMFQSQEEIDEFEKYIDKNGIGRSGYGLDYNANLKIGMFWCTAADEVWGLEYFEDDDILIYSMMQFLNTPSFKSSEEELLSFISN